jgi:hypothetical protein
MMQITRLNAFEVNKKQVLDLKESQNQTTSGANVGAWPATDLGKDFLTMRRADAATPLRQCGSRVLPPSRVPEEPFCKPRFRRRPAQFRNCQIRQ